MLRILSPSSSRWLAVAAAFAGLGVVSAQDRNVFFGTEDPGVTRSIPIWGLDLAWLNETHVRRGAIFMGQPQVDVIRCSFTGDTPVVAGDLTGSGLTEFNSRLAIVNAWTDSHTQIYLNNDTDSIHSSYQGTNGVNPFTWAELVHTTTGKFNDAGRAVVSVAPFNEPDYTTWQGNATRLGDVCWQLRNTFSDGMAGIRLYGASTLNNDQAAPWYDTLNGWGYLEEGCTHQLAGSFDSYAAFYQSVEANGDIGMNDELHNVMEAMVGAEYGMDGGIWWGTAELARGEFVKASDGKRLGYAEHRPNWTAASVYRAPDGEVLGFVGESERHAVPTTYRFFSKDRPVFYDGHGPLRSYSVTTTGAPAYWTSEHRNAEKLVRITWGEDVQPPVDGRYFLVNRKSGKVMEVAGNSQNNGANLQQAGPVGGALNQQWDVVPLASSFGGDYSYVSITAAHSAQTADLVNFSYNDGGNVAQYPYSGSPNQHWFLEYVEDGWFHIRNRWSGKYLDVNAASSNDGANVQQWGLHPTDSTHQQWRLVPVTAAIEFVAPAAPAGLVATANAVSVDLSWNANGESDLKGYNIYRAAASGGPYDMIARGVPTNSFTDASANQRVPYFYRIKAADHSLNRSPYSGTASATPAGGQVLVARHGFEGTPDDDSGNANHAESAGTATYGAGWIDSQALVLDGTRSATLPAEVANHDEITIAAWVRWDGGSDWQRIFDFGNGTDQYLYLSPKAGGGGLRFAIRNGGTEQQLNAPALAIGEWVHLAVTLGGPSARLYVNGAVVSESAAFTISPADFKPALNMLGDSQFPADPFFSGSIDDFQIYNHALDGSAVAALAGEGSTVAHWDFEDGVAGQAFTPAGQPDGSGGAVDLDSGILMRGYNEFYGPSWTSDSPPKGGGLAMDCADNHQDGYVTEGALHGWSPQRWTVECTVMLDDVSGWLTLIGRDGSSQAVAESDFYLQKNDIDGKFRVNVATVGGQRWILDGGPVIQPSTWYALAARSDGSTLTLWIDDGGGYQQVGSLDISAQSAAQNALPGTNLNWTFGRGWYNGGFVNHVDGRMDNIRFSGAALDPDDFIPLHPAPLPPAGLSATPGEGGSVSLSWTASEWATAYVVKRSAASGGPYTVVDGAVVANSYDDAGLAPGTTWYYVVEAENSTGRSTDSNEADATTWTPAEEWRFEHFETTSDDGDAADMEDPDFDGVNNLLERAFGGDPKVAENDLLPVIDPTSPLLSIIYRKSSAASDLGFTVQESTTLSGAWAPAGGVEELVSDDGLVRRIRFTRDAGTDVRLFLRVAVE